MTMSTDCTQPVASNPKDYLSNSGHLNGRACGRSLASRTELAFWPRGQCVTWLGSPRRKEGLFTEAGKTLGQAWSSHF